MVCPGSREVTSVRTLPHHMYSEQDLAPTGAVPPLLLLLLGDSCERPTAVLL